MKKILNLVLKLFVIAAVAALVLAFTNSVTEPIIKSKNEKAFVDAFTEAYPSGKEFNSIKKDVNDNIKEIIEVKDGSSVIGYVFKGLATGGYGGNIDFILGVSNEGVIQGFKAITHSETKGYGSKMEEKPFIDGVKDVNISKGVTYGPGNKDNGEIQQISGATRTTSALTNAFKQIAIKMGELSDKIQPLGEIVIPYHASNYKEIYKEADNFREVKNDFKLEKLVRIVDAYKGDQLLGHIVQLRASGFAGDIDFLLGVDLNKKIENFTILSHGESPDYGKNIESDIYKNNIVGKSLASKIKLKAQPKRDKDILLISSATVTSMGMQDAMNDAVKGLKAYDKAKLKAEKLDLEKIIKEEEAANKPAIDYLALFEGVESVEPVGKDLLNDNVTAIHKTDKGDYIIDVTSEEAFHKDGISAGILVGPDGVIKQFVYYNFNESPNWGEPAGNKDYTDKLVGKNLKEVKEFKAVDNPATNDDIQTVSKATFTTTAIVEIMNKAAEAVKALN